MDSFSPQLPLVASSEAIPPPGKGSGFPAHRSPIPPPARGMASNPPFPVVQELLWAQGWVRHGHRGTERKSKRGRSPWSHQGGSCSTQLPLQREQILRGFSSFQHSPAPPFPQAIPMLLHFYIHPERKPEERSCEFLAQHLGSTWSIPCLLFPRSLVLAAPPLPRHRGIGGKRVFLKKKHSNSLCFPKHTGSTVKPLFYSSFHRDVVLRGRVSSSSWRRGPLGLRGASFRKGTPKCRGSLKPLGQKDYRRHQRRQSNSISASSSFQKHIAKRIILGQSFKDSQVTSPESAGKEKKKRDSEEWGIILNHPLI